MKAVPSVFLYQKNVQTIKKDIENNIKAAQKSSYNRIVIGPSTNKDQDFTDFSSDIILKVNHFLDNDTSNKDYQTRLKNLQKKELQRAQQFDDNVPILIATGKDKSIELARELTIHLQQKQRVLIEMPIIDKLPTDKDSKDNTKDSITSISSWKRWNNFRSHIDFNDKFKVALELTHNLPSETELNRWLAEPVELIIIPSKMFTKPKNNNETSLSLNEDAKSICERFMKKGSIDFAIKCNSLNNLNGFDYVGYLRTIFNADEYMIPNRECSLSNTPKNRNDAIAACNQNPFLLKMWEMYKDSIKQAIDDLVEQNGDEKVFVLICGREGHKLLEALLTFLEGLDMVEMFIYEEDEKIRSDIDLMTACLLPDIGILHDDKQQLYYGKMNILISVSPECIFQSQWLKQNYDQVSVYASDNPILIPDQSKLLIEPIMAPEIYGNMLLNSFDLIDDIEFRMEAVYPLHIDDFFKCSNAHELFTFKYSIKKLYAVLSDERSKSLKFTISEDCIVSGFIGCLEIRLYKNCTLNYCNDTYFPFMYFPLVKPQSLNAGDNLIVDFRLIVDVEHKNFWYEWCIDSENAYIHNAEGSNSCSLF